MAVQKSVSYHDIIRYPLITEKGTGLLGPQNKYQFQVRPDTTANEIKKAVEKIYKVTVVSVNVMNCRGKKKRLRGREGKRPDWKKAIVTLKKGDQIELA